MIQIWKSDTKRTSLIKRGKKRREDRRIKNWRTLKTTDETNFDKIFVDDAKASP